METEIKDRKAELERVSNVTSIEASALALDIGGSKDFRIMDIEAYQRLRVRLHRVKLSTGRAFATTMNGNKVSVSRLEDEEVKS